MMHDGEEGKGRSTDQRWLSPFVQVSYLGKFHSVLSRSLLCFATKPKWGTAFGWRMQITLNVRRAISPPNKGGILNSSCIVTNGRR